MESGGGEVTVAVDMFLVGGCGGGGEGSILIGSNDGRGGGSMGMEDGGGRRQSDGVAALIDPTADGLHNFWELERFIVVFF